MREQPIYRLLTAATKLILGKETEDDPVPPIEMIQQAMKVYADNTTLVPGNLVAKWKALGFTLTDYPQLIHPATITHSRNLRNRALLLRQGLPVAEIYRERLACSRHAVVELMASGLRLPRDHETRLEWIEVILVLVAASLCNTPGTPRAPISRLPRDLIRVLAEFVHDLESN